MFMGAFRGAETRMFWDKILATVPAFWHKKLKKLFPYKHIGKYDIHTSRCYWEHTLTTNDYN